MFLFFMTQQAIAGTYVYHNDKGEQVTYFPKDYNQKSNKTKDKSDKSSDSNQDNTKQENIRKDYSDEDSSGYSLEDNFHDEKNKKGNKKKE